MVKLTRVGGEVIYLNENFIESIEATSDSDTTVKVHNGTIFVTSETPEQILEMILSWTHSRSRKKTS